MRSKYSCIVSISLVTFFFVLIARTSSGNRLKDWRIFKVNCKFGSNEEFKWCNTEKKNWKSLVRQNVTSLSHSGTVFNFTWIVDTCGGNIMGGKSVVCTRRIFCHLSSYSCCCCCWFGWHGSSLCLRRNDTITHIITLATPICNKKMQNALCFKVGR